MARSTKPRKKYRPKRNLQNPIDYVLKGVKPASQDAQTKLKVGYHLSMAALCKGEGDTHDWQNVSDALNVAMVLCELGYGEDYLSDLSLGMQAMLAMRDRYKQGMSLLFRGEEMQAVNLGLSLHDAQVEEVPLAAFEKALDEVNRRLAKGIFLKRAA